MRGDEENEFFRAYGESLALVRLHHQLLQLSPYDAVSREAWFDAARTLLATATNASEGAGWLITLAWAYKKHLGQGLPVSIIIGKLLGKRDTAALGLLPMLANMVGFAW
jgi:hypothetical protein